VSDVQAVTFEVTVRADEREGSEAKLNVVTAIIGGGMKGESGKSGGHAATLNFKIPIRLPMWPQNEKRSNQTLLRIAGSRLFSDDSSASETPFSLGPHG
jgi:hypothetical protein